MKIPDHSVQIQFRSVKRRFKGRYRRAVGPIEATALLTVILLLFLFTYASQYFVLQPAVRVDLPQAPFHDAVPYSALVLLIPQGGGCFFNDKPYTSLPELRQALATSREQAPEGRADVLLVEADAHIPYTQLIEVYTLATEAGFRQVALATRPPLQTKP